MEQKCFRCEQPATKGDDQCGFFSDPPINLETHHLDWNHSNNTPSNLALVCRSCHVEIHRPQTLKLSLGEYEHRRRLAKLMETERRAIAQEQSPNPELPFFADVSATRPNA